MGLLDGFKGGLQEQFIARPDSSKDLVLYKWPEQNIRLFSVATVQPDEWALFIKEGSVAGYLQGGQHRLDGANIPFIGGLIDGATGGNALKAELYFVSNREFANNKFGGSMGEVEDPGTGEVLRCGVFGEYVFKVVDPAKLILGLIGTQTIYSNEFIADAIRDQLTKILRATVFGKMKSEKWSLLDVTDGTYNLEFEKAIVEAAGPYLADWGLQITKIEDFLVNMDDADRQRLLDLKDRMAKMRLAGDPRYMAAGQTEAMFGAAQGMAQGGDGASMAGLFVGAGLGQTIAGGVQSGQVQQQAQQASATAVTCPGCGAAVPAGGKFCPACGAAVGPKRCANCDAELAADAKFCPSCGTKQE
ncbi:MAG TPA: SPFH domain-containing protein [Coriobacteriia bacterium]|jgi:membrane protease subunit (stomatin/prohibitin family)